MAVQEFFHRATGTLSYVVYKGHDAVVIDPCLDFDLSELRLGNESLNKIVAFLREKHLRLHWILETHVHADHVTGAHALKSQFSDSQVAIHERVCEVQSEFKQIFGLKQDVFPNGWPFDRLLKDGDIIDAGALKIEVLAAPGHTPACVCYVTPDGIFTGDVILMPHAGTGRCDFPGGSAQDLFQSIQRLYQMPDETPVHVGHNYPAVDQPPQFSTTIGDEKRTNAHIEATTPMDSFVEFRNSRDRTLSLPQLFYPSLYFNMRGGILPEPDANDRRFVSWPIFASF